ncbi:MAG TPA: MoaD/ThiS family protein [Acidimicrobiales bacterium]|nr:MoaD/ThiS family protein [Acidimicrobiales bacterium]
MARLLLLGPAREAAGVRNDVVEGSTIDDVLREAVTRYGTTFQEILDVSQVWLNGEPAERDAPVETYDEVAVLPPISGG